MKKFMSMLVIAAFIMAGTSVNANVTTGQPAPDFTLTDVSGNQHSLSQYQGKYVILEWNNPDCPFVVKHYASQNMQALQQKYTGQDVVWLTINSSAPGKQGNFDAAGHNAILAKNGSAPTAYLLDGNGEVGRLYGAQTTPHMYIVDPDGTLIYQGAIDSIPSPNPADILGATNYIDQALNEAMAGQPVSMASTKAYGCSVKY